MKTLWAGKQSVKNYRCKQISIVVFTFPNRNVRAYGGCLDL